MTRTAWRFFPHAMIAAIGLMVVIDSGLAVTALRSFPGRAADDVFDHSNSYNDVLAVAAEESALGWTARAAVQDGAASVRLDDRLGHAVRGADVQAIALRPLGADRREALVFRERTPGLYVATSSLPLPGQWELRLVARLSGDVLHTTSRVIVK